MKFDRLMMSEALRGVLQRMHYPLEVMLVCVRRYVAYPLSLRHLEETMAEPLEARLLPQQHRRKE